MQPDVAVRRCLASQFETVFATGSDQVDRVLSVDFWSPVQPSPTPPPPSTSQLSSKWNNDRAFECESSKSSFRSPSLPSSSFSPSSSSSFSSFSPATRSEQNSPTVHGANGTGVIDGHAFSRNALQALATPARRPAGVFAQTPFSARRMKCWPFAKRHSFYARDNVANFLAWCRTLGVRDVLLFESEDLVLRRRSKNVWLCLLEVARIAYRHLKFDHSPALIQLEQEIELEERKFCK